MGRSGPIRFLPAISPPLAAALLAVGLTVGGLVLGRVPIGADPDLLYRPIKAELAKSLRSATLPFWSDRFGLGVPLVAESHVAAFYPPNWVLYRAFDVGTAYRLAMWLNYLALAWATFAYARALGITPWGAAVSALAFSVCGFQAIHAGHEPFYYALPYLPLCLLLAHRYAEAGRWGTLAMLALAWGAQVTVGHFQIPLWTGGLVVLTGAWRVIASGKPWPRIAGLILASAWGVAIASVQLALTRELTELAGFNRSFVQLFTFSFPPGHLMQPALPALFAGLDQSGDLAYWAKRWTTPNEAGFYVGTLPLILACVGWVSVIRRADGTRALAPWRFLTIASLALACLPNAWPDAYRLIVEVPLLGWFRAPARYTLITSFGLALLAGHGLDRALSRRRFGAGLALAIALGIASAVWVHFWMEQENVSTIWRPGMLASRLALSALSWSVALGVVWAWRMGKVGGWGPFLAAAVELSALYSYAPVVYAWRPFEPRESPMIARLKGEKSVGLVGGKMGDLIVRAGGTVAFPYFGITAPPPNYLLSAADDPKQAVIPGQSIWLRRFGVTHGIFPDEVATFGLSVIASGADPVLDQAVHDSSGTIKRRNWKVVAYPEPFPAAWASVRESVTRAGGERGWAQIYSQLSVFPSIEEAWFERGDEPTPLTVAPARSARVRSFDGGEAVVDHDGGCLLVVRRTYYRGWSAQVDDGPWRPVLKVDAGLQGVRLDRVGPSRVRFRFEPTGLRRFGAVSIGSAGLAILVAGASAARRRSRAAVPLNPSPA